MRVLSIVLALAVCGLCIADTLYLKDGRIVGGTYLGGTAREVRIASGDQVQTFDVAEVSRIEFQSAPPPRAQVDRPQQPPIEERPRLVRAESSAPPPDSGSMTIPSGT